MIKNGYIVEPDKYLVPSFKISPFTNRDIIVNKMIDIDDFSKLEKFFFEKLQGKQYKYTKNGRHAINIALESLNLKKHDYITILTTTNNFYISGCVTKEIEKFCKWSRKIEPNTKAIFVNHEFGFPYEELMKLKEYDLPIIEDCAHSFYSNNKECSVGKVGDFVIYSFPKYFPIQIGGLLSYNDKYKINYNDNNDETKYIKKVLSYYIEELDNWKSIRRKNYMYLDKRIREIGLKTRFKLTSDIAPGVYMFEVNKEIDTQQLKEFLWNQGIENSVFYKENTIYIPVNNRLKKEDLDYFIECIKYFMEGYKVGK